MKSLLSKSKYAFLAIFLLVLSCKSDDCPVIEPPEDEKLVIEVNVKRQYWAESGASGEVNGGNKEYGMADYAKQPNNGLFGIQIIKHTWVQNTVWAARQDISLLNLNLPSYNIGDTIQIDKQPVNNIVDPLCFIFHLYSDGDAGAECYEIDDEAESPSWLLITEYSPENKMVAGELHLSLEISDECPPKFDPNAPDYITIRDFRFRAKMRE